MESTTISIHTGRQPAVVDITNKVADFVDGKGDGLLSVFALHATAGLALMETGSRSEDDLLDLVEVLLPPDDRYRHSHGSRGHGADHLLPVLIAPSLTVPVEDGHLVLGTWQSLVVVDPNRDNSDRRIRLTFLAGS